MDVLSFIKSSRFVRFISTHRISLFVMFFVALITGFPQIIARQALDSAYHGIPYLVNDSEGEYLSRVHEILDGHYTVASPTLYEYKNATVLMPPYGEFIFYALPVMLTRISLENIVFLSKFLYPALLFFFAYLCIYSLLDRDDKGAKFTAIAGALLIVLGYDAYDYRNFVSSILYGTHDSAGLLWNRLVNPITGGILLFAFLWRLLVAVLRSDTRKNYIIAGSLLAVTPGYIFSFALGATITCLIALYFLLVREWRRAMRFLSIVGIALLLNAFYLYGTLSATHGGAAQSDAFKSGMFATHVPLLNMISLVTLVGTALCFLIWYRFNRTKNYSMNWWVPVGTIALASEIVYNQQIITGRAVWPQHFVQYTTPLSMMLVVILAHNMLRPHWKGIIWKISIGIVLVIALLFGWRGFQSASADTLTKFSEHQKFAGVTEYLNEHALKDCVVYVSPAYPSEINRFIPALTSCNGYHSFYIYSGVPRERIMHNYLVHLKLLDLKVKDVRAHFYKDPFYTTSYFFRNWNDMLCNNLSGCGDKWQAKFSDKTEIDRWFAGVEREVEARYAEFLKKDFHAELLKYRLDYFVVDIMKAPRVNEKNFPFLIPQGVFDGFAIYSVAQ